MIEKMDFFLGKMKQTNNDPKQNNPTTTTITKLRVCLQAEIRLVLELLHASYSHCNVL